MRRPDRYTSKRMEKRAGMGGNVLVDTSIWIDYFRAPKGVLFEAVTRLLKNQQAVFTGLIALELIRGAKSEKELSVLDDLFHLMPRIVERETTYNEAGKIGYRLARQGATLATVDLVIAQLAIENHLALYTRDRHFTRIAHSFPLALFPATCP